MGCATGQDTRRRDGRGGGYARAPPSNSGGWWGRARGRPPWGARWDPLRDGRERTSGGSGGERRERRARDESPTHGIGSNRGDGEARGARGRRRRLDARRGDRPMIGIGLKISPRRARHSGGARTGVAAGGLGGVHGALGHRAEATGQRGSGAEDTGHLGAWRCAQLVVRLRAVRSQPVLTRSAPIGTGCASPARGPARARNPPALHLTGPRFFSFCEGRCAISRRRARTSRRDTHRHRLSVSRDDRHALHRRRARRGAHEVSPPFAHLTSCVHRARLHFPENRDVLTN